MKYMDFLLLNPVFNFHTTLYSEHIVNFIIFFTVYRSFTRKLIKRYLYNKRIFFSRFRIDFIRLDMKWSRLSKRKNQISLSFGKYRETSSEISDWQWPTTNFKAWHRKIVYNFLLPVSPRISRLRFGGFQRMIRRDENIEDLWHQPPTQPPTNSQPKVSFDQNFSNPQ